MINPVPKKRLADANIGDTVEIHFHVNDATHLPPENNMEIACGEEWGAVMATGDPSQVTCDECVISS